MKKIVILISIFISFFHHASAIPLTDRADLDTLLGENAITEDFEAFNVADGQSSEFIESPELHSGTVIDDQGPGLVVDGITISAGMNVIQWNGNNYYGLQTKTFATNDPITIDFHNDVSAFGLDMTVFQGHPDTYTMQVYAEDDATILAVLDQLYVASPAAPLFRGFEHLDGIGKVVLSTDTEYWGVIDNLTFGASAPIPEPATLFLLGVGIVGLVVIRRKLKK